MAVRAMMLVRVLRRRGSGTSTTGTPGSASELIVWRRAELGEGIRGKSRESAASAGTATVMAPELLKHLDALLEVVIGFLLQALDDAAQVVGQLRDLVIGQAFEECQAGGGVGIGVLSGVVPGLGERDGDGAAVVGRRFALDEALRLQLAEQLGHRLTGHPHQVGQLTLSHLGLQLQHGQYATLSVSRIAPGLAAGASALPAELENGHVPQPLGRQSAGVGLFSLFLFVDVVSHCCCPSGCMALTFCQVPDINNARPRTICQVPDKHLSFIRGSTCLQGPRIGRPKYAGGGATAGVGACGGVGVGRAGVGARRAGTIEGVQIPQVDWDATSTVSVLTTRLLGLPAAGKRVMVGLAGAPGAGKSTIAAALASALERELPGQVALVPMDGFHLAQSVIERAGLAEVKGAPETFDAYGYVALLSRLQHEADHTIYAPEFRRAIDDAVAGAIPVTSEVRVVITEGNYLLLDDAPWNTIRDLLDEVWYVTLPDESRIGRLIERHMQFKDSEGAARRRATVSDQRNADLVEAHTAGASLVIRYR